MFCEYSVHSWISGIALPRRVGRAWTGISGCVTSSCTVADIQLIFFFARTASRTRPWSTWACGTRTSLTGRQPPRSSQFGCAVKAPEELISTGTIGRTSADGMAYSNAATKIITKGTRSHFGSINIFSIVLVRCDKFLVMGLRPLLLLLLASPLAALRVVEDIPTFLHILRHRLHMHCQRQPRHPRRSLFRRSYPRRSSPRRPPLRRQMHMRSATPMVTLKPDQKFQSARFGSALHACSLVQRFFLQERNVPMAPPSSPKLFVHSGCGRLVA